jgi:hypothetical protein
VVTLIILIVVAKSTMHLPSLLRMSECSSEHLVKDLSLKVIHLLLSAKALLKLLMLLRLMSLLRLLMAVALILLAFSFLIIVLIQWSFTEVHKIFELI